MPMTLWVVNQYALPPDRAGITRNHALADQMLPLGVETVIVASPTSYLTRRDPDRAPRPPVDRTRRIPYVWVDAPAYRRNGVMRVVNMLVFALGAVVVPLLRLLRRQVPRPDLVLGSSPTLFAGLSAWVLARVLRVPFVLEVRDLHPLSITELTGVSPRHPYIRLLARLEAFLYRRCDLVVSPLQGAGDHVASTIGTPRPWVWIPNSVDVAQVPLTRADASATSPFTFVYAGAHGLANSLDVLVEAAELLRDEPVRFVLYGDGVAKPELRARAERLHLTNLEFADPVPKTEVHARLAAADALVFLLHDSALFDHGLSANKLYDYLAAARPVLFASNSVHNPVAASQSGVTVRAASAAALAEGARRLMLTPHDERQEMGLRGRSYVQQHFNLRDLAEILAERLRALV